MVDKEVLIDELCCTETAVGIDAFGEERYFDPSLQCADGKQSLVAAQRVVPVPDQIQPGLTKAWTDPSMLVGQDSIVSCNDRTQD
jgi:hypothetical protein